MTLFQLVLCSMALLASSRQSVLATAPLCISLEVNQTAPSNEQVANDSSVLELSGATVSLTCACTGLSSNTLLLEWYDSSGALVANGTGTAMLDIALYADATYECREGGVLVHVVNLVAVEIIVIPDTQFVVAGNSATFTCEDIPTGAGNFTYQWEFDGPVIGDQYTSELTIEAEEYHSGGYTCMATVNGVTQSAIGYLIVQVPPQVTVHPVDQTNIAPGSDVSFSVTATGTAPLSYQWQKDGVNLTDGGSITGATTATLTITGVMESDEGGFRCVISNIAGMVTSNFAMLNVAKGNGGTPVAAIGAEILMVLVTLAVVAVQT